MNIPQVTPPARPVRSAAVRSAAVRSCARRMARIAPFAAAVFLLFSHADAQSVDSLVREAYRNNPQLKALSHQADAAVYRASAAGAMPAPSLGIEFSQVPTNSANIVNDAISDNISFSQMFMLGGKLSAMSAVETKKGSVLEQTRGALLAKVRAAVKMKYLQLWRFDRQIELQHGIIRLLDELAASLRSRVQTNRARAADLLTVQAEAASERARAADLTAKRRAIQNVLFSLTAPEQASGRYGAGMTIMPDSVLPALPTSIAEGELSAALLHSNPSLLSMDRMKEMNELEITAANRELIPDLMLQAMVMRMPNGMVLTSGPRSADMIRMSADGMPTQNAEWMYSVMASITLPFAPWSSERSSAKADEMRSMNLSVDAEKQAMQREMLSTLGSAVNTFETQDSLARQYREIILPLTRDAAQAQTDAYQTGQASLPAVLDAYRMELMKTDDYLMTVMNQHMAFIEIEMMVGVPLQ